MPRPQPIAGKPVELIDVRTPAALASAAADWICGHVHSNPESVLALPTGNTPMGVYAELIARAGARVDFRDVRIFNLDEYGGLGPSNPHSFARYLHERVIWPLRVQPAQVRLLRGDAADIELECRAYDAAIAQAGGIDLCVLGLGANGHIAFNEPGAPWHLRTHRVELSAATRAAQLGATGGEGWEVPAWGVTMGIATLLEARHVLLLIAGAGKEAATQALLRGEPSTDWPVTSLITHPSLSVVRLVG